MENIDNILKELFSSLKPKQKKIINERFGLISRKKTLQVIGDDLGITRERVRQIEAQCIEELAYHVKEKFSNFIKESEGILDNLDGVCESNKFIENIKEINNFGGSDFIDNKIRFIFLIAGEPLLYKGDQKIHSFWYKSKKDKENLFNYLKKVIEFFKKEDRDKIIQDKTYKEKFNDSYFDNSILISKEFGSNVFGDFGLKEWPEITPKVIRDKAFLVLKKKQDPLHFSKIASQINGMGIDSKSAHVQTVHNELIKDGRFILVGRGIYGLRDSQYEEGTVTEVIQRILDTQGPLNPEEVVKLVNQKKILKENTILLNLQSKNNFKRLDDGRYHIKEA